MENKEFIKGEIIFREGDLGDVMYVLQEGVVDLKKKVEKGEVVLKTITRPSEFFGEMALIDGSPRSASAVAAAPTKVISIDGKSFEKMILSNGKFALKIIKILSDRIRNSNQHLEVLIDTSPRDRIISGMAGFALEFGEKLFKGHYKVSIRELRIWLNGNMGMPYDDIDAWIGKFLTTRIIVYAGTSRDHLIFSQSFVQKYDKKLK
jgi:CRP-like cAMP-binding protein